MSFVKNISGHRAQSVGLDDAAEDPKLGGKAAKAPSPAKFAQANVSEKLISKHGAKFLAIKSEMNEIGRLALTMRPHRVLQFGHSLDRFYADLGKLLDKLSEADRAAAAKIGVDALRSFVDRVGAGDRLVPTIETLSSLLFAGSPSSKELPDRAQAATVELEAMLSAVEGRIGGGTLLLGFRNLSEAAAKGLEKEPLGKRLAVWRAASKYLLGSSPASGASQGQIGVLVGHYFASGEKDPFKAFAQAQQAARAPFQAAIRVAIEQLAVAPKRIRADAPGVVAHQAIASALTALLGKHPVGPPSLIELVENLNGKMIDRVGAITADEVSGYQTIGKLIRLVAGQSSAEAVLGYVFKALPKLASQTKAMVIFDGLKSPDAIPRAILEGRAAHMRKEVPELAEGLQALDRLPPMMAAAVALALVPHLNDENAGPLLKATLQFAQGADTFDQVDRFAKSFTACFPVLANHLGKDQGLGLASALATELDGRGVGDRARAVGRIASQILQTIPDLALAKLVTGERAGEAGILQIPEQNAQNRIPVHYATQILQPIADAPNLTIDAKTVLARRAIHVGLELSRLDRDPDQVMERVVEDWSTALTSPQKLHFALKAGKRAAVQPAKPTALGFLESHPELPAELALTAGLHLSADQIAWVIDRIQNERSHGKIRLLRDFIFAAIEANQLGFVETLRTSESTTKAKDAVIALVAQEYRLERLDGVAFDQLKKGLKAGKDPAGDLVAGMGEAALAEIFAGKGKLEHLDPEGVAAIQRHQETVQSFVQFFPDGQKVWNLPTKTWKEPLMAWLRALAEGTLDEYKYGNPIAAQQLANLSAAAKEIWMSEGVTGGQVKPQKPVKEAPDMIQLLKGLPKVLGSLKLGNKELPGIGFDAASLAKLTSKKEQLLATLHANKKGSDAHAEASGKIGPLNDRIAVIELELALGRWVRAHAPKRAAILKELKPLLLAAVPAVRHFGGEGVAGVMAELASRISTGVKAEPRAGLYATDDHRLESYLTSFGAGSCIDPANGFNRPCIVEKMASGRYKMIRAMNGEKPQARGFLRLMDVKTGKYKGYALWIDDPKATPNGNTNEKTTQLMYEHTLDKAMAMGIPFFCSSDNGVSRAAKERGLKSEELEVTVLLDRGITGNHHTEGLEPIGPYGVKWPESTWEYGYQTAAGPKAIHEMSGSVTVVFPKGVAH